MESLLCKGVGYGSWGLFSQLHGPLFGCRGWGGLGERPKEGVYKDGLVRSGLDIVFCLPLTAKSNQQKAAGNGRIVHGLSSLLHISSTPFSSSYTSSTEFYLLALLRRRPASLLLHAPFLRWVHSYLRRFGLPRSMRQATPSPAGRLCCRIQSNMYVLSDTHPLPTGSCSLFLHPAASSDTIGTL